MKFKKEALRKIIQEELQAVLSEQNSSTALDANLINDYPQVRKKAQQKGLALIDKLASLGALNQDQGNRFRREINNSQTSGTYLLSLIKDLESEANKYELSDEIPSDIASKKQLDKIARSQMRAARLNRQVVQLQKALGVRADGIIGPKTVAAYNARVKPDKPITVQTLKSLMRKPNMIASLIGGMAPGKAPAMAVAAPKGKARPQLSAKDRAEIEAGLKDLEGLDTTLEDEMLKLADELGESKQYDQFKRFLK